MNQTIILKIFIEGTIFPDFKKNFLHQSLTFGAHLFDHKNQKFSSIWNSSHIYEKPNFDRNCCTYIPFSLKIFGLFKSFFEFQRWKFRFSIHKENKRAILRGFGWYHFSIISPNKAIKGYVGQILKECLADPKRRRSEPSVRKVFWWGWTRVRKVFWRMDNGEEGLIRAEWEGNLIRKYRINSST